MSFQTLRNWLVAQPWRWMALGYLLLWLLLHPALLVGHFYMRNDALGYTHPFGAFYRDQLMQGHLLQWNPTILGGYPTFYDMPTLLFYPVRLLLIWLPFHWTMTVSLVFHGVWLALGVALYLGQRGVPPLPRWLAGWWVLVCGVTAGSLYSGHQVFLEAGAWVGWILLAWEGWRRTTNPRYVAGMAFCLAASFLCGHFQITLYITYFFVLVAVADWLTGRIRFGRALLGGAGAFVLMALLLGFFLLPMSVYSPLASRNFAPPAFNVLNSLPPPALAGALWPYAYVVPQAETGFSGFTPEIFYLALPTSALVIVLMSPKKSWGLLLLAAVTALLALGGFLPGYLTLIKVIPGLSSLRTPPRIFFITALCVAMAAGWALPWLPPKRWRWWGWLGLAAALAGFGFYALSQGFPAGAAAAASRFLMVKMEGQGPAGLARVRLYLAWNGYGGLAIGGAMLAGWWAGRRFQPLHGVLLTALLEGFLFILPLHVNTPLNIVRAPGQAPPSGGFTGLSNSPVQDGPSIYTLLQQGIYTPGGYFPMTFQTHLQALNRLLGKQTFKQAPGANMILITEYDQDALDFLGVRWWHRGKLAPGEGWHENRSHFGRAWLVRQKPAETWPIPRQIRFIRQNRTGRLGGGYHHPNAMIFRADCGPDPCVLMTNHGDAPGWSFRVNTKPVKHGRYLGHFITLKLPAGKSTVRGDFRIEKLPLGIAVSALGWLVLLGLLLAGRDSPTPGVLQGDENKHPV